MNEELYAAGLREGWEVPENADGVPDIALLPDEAFDDGVNPMKGKPIPLSGLTEDELDNAD